MVVTEMENVIKIDGLEDFEPERIFECGQCFRWDRQPDGSYIGVVGSRAARVVKNGESVFISGTAEDFGDIWRDYFDLDRDYALVRERVAIDDYMTSACRFGRGIRILHQDKWEALCSFIISQCNNITRIKGIVSRLCGTEHGGPRASALRVQSGLYNRRGGEGCLRRTGPRGCFPPAGEGDEGGAHES